MAANEYVNNRQPYLLFRFGNPVFGSQAIPCQVKRSTGAEEELRFDERHIPGRPLLISSGLFHFSGTGIPRKIIYDDPGWR
jgi:hypothetical protein